MLIEKNISLKRFNTFGIDIKAGLFVVIKTIEQLRHILSDPNYNKYPKLILGGGSNILFTHDFDGLVIKLEIKGKEIVTAEGDQVFLKAGAGENWHELVLYCIENNLAGVENLSLIPGTVGAAPMQNIGAYGVEVKEVFHELEALEIETGEVRRFSNEDCRFGYRESIFKKEYKDKYVIVYVTFKLSTKPVFNTSYGAITDTLKSMNADLSIKAISDAVIQIRRSKLPDPAQIGNAGSFFKNPEISLEQYNLMQKSFPNIPGYPTRAGFIKVPAGWFIEQAGWKGKRVGETGVHKDQALVLVNYGNANGDDVKKLAFEVLNSVKQKFGIELSPEVNII